MPFYGGKYKKYRKYKKAYKNAKRGKFLNQRIKKVTLQQQELKWYYNELFLSSTNATQAWQLFDFPVYKIQQGTGRINRIGTKIWLESVELGIQLAGITANTTTNGSTCRLIVYHKIDCEGTQTVASDIFTSYTDAGAGAVIAPNFVSTKTLEFYPKRATIVWDKMHSMYATTSDSAGLPTAVGPKYDAIVKIPIRKMINYIGNGGTIADVRGHLWGFGFCADDTNCCNIKLDVRMRFKDMS